MMKSLIILPLACSFMFFLSVASANTDEWCNCNGGPCCEQTGECGYCQGGE